jgi:hypothetical protein
MEENTDVPKCQVCGRPKDDSSMHLDSHGLEFGATLHWFVPPVEESQAPPAKDALSDGLAEALRKLIRIGDRNTNDWNNARKALATYEKAKGVTP